MIEHGCTASELVEAVIQLQKRSGVALAELLSEPCWNLTRTDVADLIRRIDSIQAVPFTADQLAALFVAMGHFEATGSKKCAASIRSIIQMVSEHDQ